MHLRFLMAFVGTLVLGVGRATLPAYAACFAPGEYESQPLVRYDCCFGAVSFTITRWRFEDLGGDQIRVTPLSGSPQPLMGTINCASGSFLASVQMPGGCTERYTLVGQFTAPGRWTGTFSADYTGSDCSCLGFDPCTDQQWPVMGIIPGVAVEAGGADGPSLAVGPNPFRESGQIHLALARPAHVVAEILDLGGRVVAKLRDEPMAAGAHRLEWNRTTRAAVRAPSGLYLVRVRIDGVSRVAKLVAVD